MKNISMSIIFLFTATFILAGCGSKVDQNRPISQIVAEAKNMSVAQLQQMAGEYQKAIEAKRGDIQKLQEKIQQIPMTQLVGEESRKLQNDVIKIKEAIKSLTERMNVYVQELKAKGGSL